MKKKKNNKTKPQNLIAKDLLSSKLYKMKVIPDKREEALKAYHEAIKAADDNMDWGYTEVTLESTDE